ncbi:MAG: acetyl/propionyl/methylcrotonyl-CoA carboxylase subunit alpha [Rhodobacteraceae bacterium]|nr:acetyl/propionyl/methylcrotonyl-CoA carboxylase subunit alpha [Paracoccaceae bacterium]
MFEKILIANRGEIACRVARTARRMGIPTVAVYSDADAQALHVTAADEAVRIGPPAAAQSYLAIDRILDAVRQTGAQAVHPGYGFLSERAEFAEALAAEGVAFIGPPVAAIRSMGDKIASKALAAEAGVSTVPGHMGLIKDGGHAVEIAREIGYPVMVKASAGGGGKGMRVARDDAEAREGFARSKSEAAASFGDDRIFIEKFVTRPRHIEIQVLGDTHGNCLWLGERECSIQRRNQKIIEEAPSPFLDAATRRRMGEQAVALAKAVDYASAGTVEFIVDAERNFYFLEMNTRLQVEHPVTELITGIDLVEQMIRVAAGEPLAFAQEDVRLDGWAIESRLYAEDPYRDFLPATGRLKRYRPPAEFATPTAAVRNDTGVFEGGEISIHYDPMIAKLCVWAPDRAGAIEAMRGALDAFEVEGIGHNLPFLSAVMDHPRFVAGEITTAFIAEEYPDGFHGVELPEETLRDLAAIAFALNLMDQRRAAKISGGLANHGRVIGDVWVVGVGARAWRGALIEDAAGVVIDFDGGSDAGGFRLEVDPVHGSYYPPASVSVNGRKRIVKIELLPTGYRMRYRGADLKASVLTLRHAELAALMPVKAPSDTSRLLLCPMPGLVTGIYVVEGEEVHNGQPLAMVEAMKMENVLRAERRGRIARIRAEAGASLAVDDVILEFE